MATERPDRTPLRRATLANQVERFLLDTMAAGYQADEVEQALRMALDRWHSLAQATVIAPEHALRFAGSHDPAVSLVAARFGEIAGGVALQLSFNGSLGGLIALAQGEADLAGCHLWDAATDTYNTPFVQRLLPGRRVLLLTLAHRRLGLLLAPGNPAGIAGLPDLVRSGVRFVNRQPGAGTRVWLDAQLHRLGIDPGQVSGYGDEALTHSEVARSRVRWPGGRGTWHRSSSVGLWLGLCAARDGAVRPGDVARGVGTSVCPGSAALVACRCGSPGHRRSRRLRDRGDRPDPLGGVGNVLVFICLDCTPRRSPAVPRANPPEARPRANGLRRVDNFVIQYDPHSSGGRMGRFQVRLVRRLGLRCGAVTTLESAERFRQLNPRLPVLGVEIDPPRALRACPMPKRTHFRLGGFNLPLYQRADGSTETLRLIRAFNVLRQYEESEVPTAWSMLADSLAPGGLLVEGTSEPFGRLRRRTCCANRLPRRRKASPALRETTPFRCSKRVWCSALIFVSALILPTSKRYCRRISFIALCRVSLSTTSSRLGSEPR